MKINIYFTSLKYYNLNDVDQWFWYFKRYTYINGFIVRFCGIYINCREHDATEKLIKIWITNNERL